MRGHSELGIISRDKDYSVRLRNSGIPHQPRHKMNIGINANYHQIFVLESS